MRRPEPFPALPIRGRRALRRSGYTLVEILTATVLMIIIMLAVTIIFASVTESIGQSRATLEMTQRIRSASALLKQDLESVTATMSPPLHPRNNEGYFTYVEGPIGPVVDPANVAWNVDNQALDSTVGDIDDILMFTARTRGEPYVGLVDTMVNGVPVPLPTTSHTAEIIWFVRGRTLYRRVLLVKPDANIITVPAGFYARNDLSVSKDWRLDGNFFLKANTLADLTKPEARFAHHPDPRIWTATASGVNRRADERRPHPFFYQPWRGFAYGASGDPIRWVPGLGLPILAECSAGNWRAGEGLPINPPIPNPNPPTPPATPPYTPAIAQNVANADVYDAWATPHPWTNVDPLTGTMTGYAGARIGEDVVLTNVISFDVKAWDPLAPIVDGGAGGSILPGDPGYIQRIRNGGATVLGTGAYVDLNYLARLGPGANPMVPNVTGLPGHSWFSGPGDARSRVYGTLPLFAVPANPNPAEFYPAVYDTWSLHYEHNQRVMNFGNGPERVGDEDRNGIFDRGSNGIDDLVDGVRVDGVDDIGERETQPPYAVPLQGIQVRIRTFEPGSRQVREISIVQKFRTR